MKRAGKIYIITASLFACIFVLANLLFGVIASRQEGDIYVLMNRVFRDIEEGCEAYSSDELTEDVVTSIIRDVYYTHTGEYSSEYGTFSLPQEVYYIPSECSDTSVTLLNRDKEFEKVWMLGRDGNVLGFVVFEFAESGYVSLHIMLNISIAACFVIALAICIYINLYVLRPFTKFASYPEKLSKNQLTEKLPETKNRLFGRFTWGINMLNDKLASDRKRINELSRDHLTMLTTIAHGIKTPVANIKLYADAIETGLYQPEGKVNESDAEVAAKISKNADNITDIVKELIDKASGGFVDFEPEISSFYLTELTDFLSEEYGKRLDVLRIPYQ